MIMRAVSHRAYSSIEILIVESQKSTFIKFKYSNNHNPAGFEIIQKYYHRTDLVKTWNSLNGEIESNPKNNHELNP